MKELKIKTRRDWCLAFIFTLIIVYAISTRFSFAFQSWLLRYGNPMLTDMNQPKSYGNVIFTILVMTVITEIVLIRYRKSKKAKGILAVGGIAAAAAVFGMYLFNTNLIVSAIEEEAERIVSIGYWGGDDLEIPEEQQKEIIALCEELKPVSEEEESRLEEDFYAEGDVVSRSVLIWAVYPKRYGHNFDMMVCVYGDQIYVRKGYDNRQNEIVTFFEDNGLVEKINEYR